LNLDTIAEAIGSKHITKEMKKMGTLDHDEYVETKFSEIGIDEIKLNDNQVRFNYDLKRLETLSCSIRELGVLEPIIVCKPKNGIVQLIAGQRRLKAAKMAGLNTIPAIFHKDEKKFEISLVENLQRVNLSPVEKAEAMANLKKNYGYTQKRIGELLGLVQSAVAEYLTLMNLPEDIRIECKKTSKYSKRKLLKIAKNKTPRQMRKEFNFYKENVKKKTNNDNENDRRITASKISITVKKFHKIKARLEKIEKDWNFEDPQEKKNLLSELKCLKNFVQQKQEILSENAEVQNKIKGS